MKGTPSSFTAELRAKEECAEFLYDAGCSRLQGRGKGGNAWGVGPGLQAAALERAAVLEDARRALRLAEGGEHWSRGGSAEGQGGWGGEGRACC